MSQDQPLHVSIGEVKVGRGDNVLKASLGSCVAIGLFWKDRQVYGLAHCLLPEAPSETTNIGGRFVTQAVPSLIALMKIQPEDRAQVEAILVGGANMTSAKETDPNRLIGILNSRKARDTLVKYNLKLIYADTGGEEARQVVISCADGTFSVRKIPRIA